MRDFLRQVDEWLAAGADDAAISALAFAAGQSVEVAEDELARALRQAMLVLAAGGDVHREFGLDDPAVDVVARETETETRRAALATGLAELGEDAQGLAAARAIDRLLADPDLAWRAFAASLLADELGEE